MCGITGLINCGNAEILKKITSLLAHRGPDNEGIKWFDDTYSGVGHRRLSIIDLSSAGHQPMTNEKGNLWIVHNGEIFNYMDIRKELINKGFNFKSHSDTEVILKAYESWGVKCLDKFNGMFSFAIYDKLNKKLFAARDRVGIKPFYYFHKNNTFIFASEIKAIAATGLVPIEPDYYALHNPTTYQISPLTGFKNIYKLHPGHYLIFENGNLSINKYWDINPREEDLKEEDAVEKLNSLLNDSVRIQTISDVPIGIFLSGGLDSSIISALMKKNVNQQISAFTIKFSEHDQKFERMPNDYKYAKEVASKFGFEHKEFEISPDIVSLLPKLVWHLDEPLADPASINTYIMSKYARENGTIVLLNGMGGDEIYGGYRKQLACLKADLYQRIIPKALRKGIESFFKTIPAASSSRGFRTSRWAKRFFSFASLSQLERCLVSDLSMSKEQYKNIYLDEIEYWETHFVKSHQKNLDRKGMSYLTKMCLDDTKIFLSEHNLTYSDKSSMAAGVEGRQPLTDHRLIEFMFSLKPKFRIKGITQKYLLKKVAEKYLPKSIINRPKAPFGCPLRSWIRGPLSEMINDYLSEESLNKRKIYNSKYIHNIIKKDREGLEDNSLLIWTFLTNEIWFQIFFDKSISP